MSDDDRDIDVESDDGDDSDSRQPLARAGGGSYYSQVSSVARGGRKKKEYHNSLERSRRGQLKRAYEELADAIPNSTPASRQDTLMAANDYMRELEEAKRRAGVNFKLHELPQIIEQLQRMIVEEIQKSEDANHDLEGNECLEKLKKMWNFDAETKTFGPLPSDSLKPKRSFKRGRRRLPK